MVSVNVDLSVLIWAVEREVTASRVVDFRVEDSTVAGSRVVDSVVVNSGIVGLRVVVSRFIILRVVGSCEVVSSEMVSGVVVSGSNIFVGDFSVVVVGIGVVRELAEESVFVDVLVSKPLVDELKVMPLPPPFLAPPIAPSVVASPLFPSLVVDESPSVVRGLSTCLSIKFTLHGSDSSITGAVTTPSSSTKPS